MDHSSVILFIVIAVVFSLVIIMRKDTLPAALKRPLAIMALLMMVCAFSLLVYSLFKMG